MKKEEIVCSQEIALEVIKKQPNNGGLSENMLYLAERQCQDYKKISTKLVDIEESISNNSDKLEQLIELHEKSTVWDSLEDVLKNKFVLYVLIYVMFICVCCICGVEIGKEGAFILNKL